MGIALMQEYQDLLIWEHFFDEYPLKTFIEFGSGYGGMSLFFAMQCHQRGIQFITFDHEKYINLDTPLSTLLDLRGKFRWKNIFADESISEIQKLISESMRPLGIFFDNGDKPREWRTFAPYTIPGDFCIVHDWETEFKQEDIGNVSVEKIMQPECDARIPGWKAMWFKRV